MTATQIVNPIHLWRDAAGIIGITDVVGLNNAFVAARETSRRKPGIICVVVKSDGSRTSYRDGQKLEPTA